MSSKLFSQFEVNNNLNINLDRLKINDILRAANLAKNAYINEELAEYIFPDQSSRSQKLFEFFYFRLNIQRQFCSVTLPEILALIISEPPGQHNDNISILEIAYGFPMTVKIGIRSLSRLLKLQNYFISIRKNLISEPFWYFDFIAVDPNHRRCKLGKMLIENLLIQVDKNKAPVYLETQNPNYIKLYESFGFKIASQGKIPETNIPNFCMIRPKA